MLIYIGATMTAFPIFYAVIENDLRRVLAYSLNNQLGFMVVGIGIGTRTGLERHRRPRLLPCALQGLLFMSMGAVLYRTGKVERQRAGRPVQVHAADHRASASSARRPISAFPLFSGFVTKSMILTAVPKSGTW